MLLLSIIHRDRAIDLVVMDDLGLQRGQDPVPDTSFLPAPKATVHGLPGTIPLRQIPPWLTSPEDPRTYEN